MNVSAEELLAIENAVLQGLEKARMNSLGSGETGAQPNADEETLPSSSPADSADSPLENLLNAVSASDWRKAYDLGHLADDELLSLRKEIARLRWLFFYHVGTDPENADG